MNKFIVACLSCCSLLAHGQESKPSMKALYNGKDLEGWYTFLKTKGKNNDPEKVFQIESDGLLHISGKEFGYICTEKTFRDFHLLVEFKWGKKKYPPRDADTARRDNGILYYVPLDAKDLVWPRGIECQIQEGDVGDFWMVDSATIVVDGKRTPPMDYCRSKKKEDAERPTGEWNLVEVISKDGNITHIVNGKKVNEGTDPSIREGKIIIQSEGAEIYYRKILIAPLN